MAAPVYLFAGFLDSGKTTLIMDTLNDKDFMKGGGRTLILCFEQGETEYTEEFLDEHNAFIEFFEASTQLTKEKMQELDTIYHPDQVFIEYNGSEVISETILRDMPPFWPLVEILTTVDASTFAQYIQNMRSIMFEQIRWADVVICNRCTPDTSASLLRGNIKAMNKVAQIFYEGEFGAPVELKGGLLPFDKKASVIDINDDDYGLWYMDAGEHPDDYEEKTVIVRGAYAENLPGGYKQSFVLGRRAMVCCEADTSLCGITVTGVKIEQLTKGNWYEVEGILRGVPLENGAKTLVLYAQKIKNYPAPRDQYVYFS
ncbi:MAG: hypothetical protein IJJ24_07955 [Solobacterium sp.]|nr:hypothetical protein [Solobacterium sp.]